MAGQTLPPLPTGPVGSGPGGGRRTPLGLIIGLVAAAVVVVAVIIGAVVWMVGRGSGGDVVEVQPAPVPWQSTAPATPASPTTAAVTPVAPTPTFPTQAAPRDYGGVDCGTGVAAVGPTSCAFALSVRDAYFLHGGSTYLPDVYSPVTGQYYEMFCSATSTLVRCTGGNDAEVVFRP